MSQVTSQLREVAAATVDFAGAATPIFMAGSRRFGFTTVVGADVGQIIMTLATPLAPNVGVVVPNALVLVSVFANAVRSWSTVFSSSTILQVLLATDAGVAVDSPFSIAVYEIVS